MLFLRGFDAHGQHVWLSNGQVAHFPELARNKASLKDKLVTFKASDVGKHCVGFNHWGYYIAPFKVKSLES